MAVAKKELSVKEISALYKRNKDTYGAFTKDAKGNLTEIPNKLAGQTYWTFQFYDDAGKKIVFTTRNEDFVNDHDNAQLAIVTLEVETVGTGANITNRGEVTYHSTHKRKIAEVVNGIRGRKVVALEAEVAGEKINDFSLNELATYSI